MSRALGLISRFLVTEDGPTSVEYAAMLGLIAVAIVGVSGPLA